MYFSLLQTGVYLLWKPHRNDSHLTDGPGTAIIFVCEISRPFWGFVRRYNNKVSQRVVIFNLIGRRMHCRFLPCARAQLSVAVVATVPPMGAVIPQPIRGPPVSPSHVGCRGLLTRYHCGNFWPRVLKNENRSK